MGTTPHDIADPDPEMQRVIAHLVRSCRERGLIAGMLAPDGCRARQLIQRGFQFVTLTSDLTAVRSAVRGWLAQSDG